MICPHCHGYFEHSTEELRLRVKFREIQLLVRSQYDTKELQRYNGWEVRGRAIAKAELAARQNSSR